MFLPDNLIPPDDSTIRNFIIRLQPPHCSQYYNDPENSGSTIFSKRRDLLDFLYFLDFLDFRDLPDMRE
jgi:hypothetical protein